MNFCQAGQECEQLIMLVTLVNYICTRTHTLAEIPQKTDLRRYSGKQIHERKQSVLCGWLGVVVCRAKAWEGGEGRALVINN